MINRITLKQVSPTISLKQGPSILLKQNQPSVRVGGQKLTILQRLARVTIYAEVMQMTRFIDFSFVATQGQTIFVLEDTPIKVWLFINGVYQSQEKGDFSVSGKNITMAEGLDSGDNLCGIYQKSL